MAREFNNEGEIARFLPGNFTAWKVLFATESGQCSPAEGAALLKLSTESFQWLRSVAFKAVEKIAHPLRYPDDYPNHPDRRTA